MFMMKKKDIRDVAKIFDLGDIKIPRDDEGKVHSVFAFLDEKIPAVVRELESTKKKPFMLGGRTYHHVFLFQRSF